MPLTNCEINLMLLLSENCVSSSSTGTGTLTITDTKGDDPVVSLSTNGNKTLSQQLNTGSKRTINWDKHPSKVSTQAQN